MLATEAPFPQYFDLDGSPLDGGKLYFGLPNQDPETNPIPVYWDVGGTIPAAQPIRTLNGYAARSGTPANVFVDGDYSINVRSSSGKLLYYAPNSNEFSLASTIEGVYTDLADTTDPTKGAALVGYNPTLAYPDATIGRHAQERLSVTDAPWLAAPGEADSLAKIQAAIDWAASVGGREVYVCGFFNTSGAVLLRDNVTLMGPGSRAAGLRCSSNTAAVVQHTSAATAALNQSVIGLTLEHVGLPANRYSFTAASGIAVPAAVTASGGVYDDVRIINACDGISIGGELFAYRIGTIETQYCFRAWHKFGTGACTSLTIDFFRMFACFHGMHLNNTTYSEINFYADHCGLDPAAGFGPADQMPILFDAYACHLTIPTFGMEVSPAVMFRANGFSKINIGSAGLVFVNTAVWKASATRIANIPQAEQALLISLSQGSAVSWSSFDLDMQIANGFPTAAANASNLYYIPAADSSMLTFKAASIYTDSYYWTAPSRIQVQGGLVYDYPNVNFRDCVTAFAFHTVYGLTALVSLDSVLWTGLPQRAEDAVIDIVPTDAGRSVVMYAQGAATLSGAFKNGDVVMLYNNTGNAAGILITPTGGMELRWAGNTAVSAPRLLADNGSATLLFIQPNVAVISGFGVT